MITNGYECIIESIKIFETKLNTVVENKAPEENIQSAFYLAEKSGYSLWHFIRLFSSTTGITPKSYISSRIFTECAKLLILKKDNKNYQTISFIANLFGFESAANFSKAFKVWSGHTPAEVRKTESLKIVSSVLQEPLALPVKAVFQNKDGKLQSEIIVCKSLHVTGLSFYLDKPILSFDKLWKTFSSKFNKINCRTQPEFMQYTAWNPSEDGSNSDGQMVVMCAAITDEEDSQLPIFINKKIPGGRFLHVVHTGNMNTIGLTYQKIYGNYFANSNLKLTSGWEYQMYRDDRTDIYIPLF